MPIQCPTCGAQVPEDAQVCPECGMVLSGEAAPEAPQPPETPQVPEVSQPPEIPQVPEAPQPPTITAPAQLLLKRGGILTGQEFPIGGQSVIIGRFDVDKGPVDLDLSSIPEGVYISRHHAVIYCDPSGQWFVKDLGSSNGTFIWRGGTGQFQRIPPDEPTPINDGDEIAFGNARFVFRIG